jgi:hypothetical protein
MDLLDKWRIAEMLAKLLRTANYLSDDPNYTREDAVEDIKEVIELLQEWL